MNVFQAYFNQKLKDRESNGLLRKLRNYGGLVDLSSNDFLGIATAQNSGATGSRLISGNFSELENLEEFFAKKLEAPSALYYNSGYMANIGVLPVITDRSTTIICDELIHASLRDGIRLSKAKHVVFSHNNISKLEELLLKIEGKKLIVIESVYSMDGDSPDIEEVFNLAEKFGAGVMVDEAHGTGLTGENNLGQAQQFINHPNCVAIVYPLGKSAGLSGAFVVGSKMLKQYLINFSRSFIYTTGPSKQLVIQLRKQLETMMKKDTSFIFALKSQFLNSLSSHYQYITGPYGAGVGLITADKTQNIESALMDDNLFVKAILSPTVQRGMERIRICFHDFNTKNEIDSLLSILNSRV
ncbi:MAG: pyridoxal phosphate-dependent aminotransferase family protein [Bacteroidota bacterium]|nr:pyridoxal phosphate-dependent aminotransferase family protein [Bacteroidota bacterium]